MTQKEITKLVKSYKDKEEYYKLQSDAAEKANVKKVYNNLASRYSALKEIVEKQIKVEKICTIAQENGREVCKFYTCPICNRTVLAGQKYCGRCGQKLLVKEGE